MRQCPFCGMTENDNDEGSHMLQVDDGLGAVRCEGCGALGPEAFAGGLNTAEERMNAEHVVDMGDYLTGVMRLADEVTEWARVLGDCSIDRPAEALREIGTELREYATAAKDSLGRSVHEDMVASEAMSKTVLAAALAGAGLPDILKPEEDA